MAETVIKVEKLGKQYEIGSRGNSMDFRDKLVEIVKTPFNFLSGKKHIKKNIWALKDVSFEVKKGEVIGVIGKNGSGKSTLLKILSRITEPTIGQITINGRVSSLLEVGTGFHPELTGRENIYLNGAILGMKKKEIDSKFSEIVEFSGVEKFLDTPVKKYSSGMYVRLAFAVAAHLEPEILLVDEVLAVGDAEFQKKCLGKMKDVAKGGRTILFVSHNLGAITSLCSKVILLDEGKITDVGSPYKITKEYFSRGIGTTKECYVKFSFQPKLRAQIISLKLLTVQGDLSNTFSFGEKAKVEICYEVRQEITNSNIVLVILMQGIEIWKSFDTDKEKILLHKRPAGKFKKIVEIPINLLKPGDYSVASAIGQPGIGPIDDEIDNGICFQIRCTKFDMSYTAISKNRFGVLGIMSKWKNQ